MKKINVNRWAGGADKHGLAQALVGCSSIAELRAMTPLPDTAQRLIDKAVVSVGLERLSFVKALIARGLTFPIADPLGVMEVYWEKESKAGAAQRTMLPGSRGENQLTDRSGVYIPIYATWDDFQLNIRTLRASERAGVPLDTSMVAQATRRVNEAIEDAAINGAGVTVRGNATPGLVNAPNAAHQGFVSSQAWDNAAHTGNNILTDVLNMITKAQQNNRFGPYALVTGTLYGNKLNDDFKANSALTIMQRLNEIDTSGGAKLEIIIADRVPADTAILVQMTSNVVDLIDGQEPIPVSWTDGSGFNRYFTVMAFQVPRIRDDYDGKSGIVIGTPSGV